MAQYSRRSKDYLATCHLDIQILFKAVIEDGYDHTVICGYREEEAQTAAYESGASKVQWPNGKHNKFPSEAIDVIPYNRGIDWTDELAIAAFAGKVLATANRLYKEHQMHHRVRWGGDWDMDGKTKDQRFNDLVHFELVM